MFAKISVEPISFAESEVCATSESSGRREVTIEGTGEDIVVASIDYFSGWIHKGSSTAIEIGNIVVDVETSNNRREEVIQPTTVYVFTSQGSQEQGVGMDLYNYSPAARAVQDGANAHPLAIMASQSSKSSRQPEKEDRALQGQAVRQRYMGSGGLSMPGTAQFPGRIEQRGLEVKHKRHRLRVGTPVTVQK